MKIKIFLIVCFFTGARAAAQTLSERQFYLGAPVPALSASMAAMGNVGAACVDSASAVKINPALLSRISPISVELNSMIYSQTEKQIHRDAGNSFDQTQFWHADLPYFFASYAHNFWGLGAGYFTSRDFNYQFEKNIYDLGRPLLIQNAREEGSIQTLAFSASCSYPGYPISLGATWLKHQGQTRSRLEYFIYDADQKNLTFANTESSQSDWSAQQWQIGFFSSVNAALRLGFTVDLPYCLEQNQTGANNGNAFSSRRLWQIPPRFTTGLAYQTPDWLLALDVAQQSNSQTRMSADGQGYTNIGFSDTIEYHLGAQQHWTPRLDLRYGVALATLPQDSRSQSVDLSLGLGYSWPLTKGQIKLGLALNYQMRSDDSTARLFTQTPDADFPDINRDSTQNRRLVCLTTLQYQWGKR